MIGLHDIMCNYHYFFYFFLLYNNRKFNITTIYQPNCGMLLRKIRLPLSRSLQYIIWDLYTLVMLLSGQIFIFKK